MLKRKLLLVFLLLLIIPTFSKILRSGYFPMHDDMQAMRLLQMDKCIKDGQIPCRWVPDMGYGYGYPQFNYYAPLPYYLMEAVHLLGFGYLDSVKAVFVLSVVISAFGMLLFASSLWGEIGGLISALLYTYAPYRAVEMYVRGAVGEFWALAFLPLILWSAKQTVEGKKKGMVWLAISLTALFMSHNITSLIFMPVLLIWIIFLYFINKDSPTALLRKTAKDIIFGVLWGFSISAFFILPAWFERNFVHIETLLMGYFNYLAHFVGLRQLLLSTYFGYGSSELGPYDDISLTVGLIHWILPILSIVIILILKKKKELLPILFFVVIGWLSLFLTHSKSVFIWDRLPIFAYLQFPWRFLTMSIFAFSVASGSIALVFPKNNRFTSFIVGGIIVFTLILYSSYFRPQKWINISDKEKFSGKLWDKQQTISIFDYLPIYAKLPPAKVAPDEPKIIEGKAKIVSGEKHTNWQIWEVEVLSERAGVQLPIYDFPGWKVWVDGQETLKKHDNDLGLITFMVSLGKHEVQARLTDTSIRTIGNFATLAGLIAIPIYISKEKKKK